MLTRVCGLRDDTHMAYKIHVGNNIVVECDTMQEVLGLLAVFGLVSAVAASQKAKTHTPRTARGKTSAENQQVEIVLAALRDGPPEGVRSEEIGKVLGLESSTGLGPKAKILARALRRRKLDINRVRKLKHTARNGSYWVRGEDFSQALSQFGLEPAATIVLDTSVSQDSESWRTQPEDVAVERRGGV